MTTAVNPPGIPPAIAPSNYLKSYPYLFVRETDQTDYFCTICDSFLKEEALQSHLFDGHSAENLNDYFVRVCAETASKGLFLQKKFLYICVVCWAKMSNIQEMAAHRSSCKVNFSDTGENIVENASDTPPVQQGESMRVDITPDIPNFAELEKDDPTPITSNGHEPPIVKEIDILKHLQMNGQLPFTDPRLPINPHLNKKKLPGAPNGGDNRELQYSSQCIQCSLCAMVLPSPAYLQHLRIFHRVTCPLENINCPLCMMPIPLMDLTVHFASTHGIVPQSAVNSMLLWVLASNTFALNGHAKANLQSKFKGPNPNEINLHINNILPSVLTTPNNNLPPPITSSIPLLNGTQTAAPILSSFLKNAPSQAQAPPIPSAPPPIPGLGALGALPPIPTMVPPLGPPPLPQNTQLPSEPSGPLQPLDKIPSLEGIVAKLTRSHTGPDGKESFQCLLCSKWFAVPPVKHMRGHIIKYREEKRKIAQLIGGKHVCLICFSIFENQQAAAMCAASHDITVEESNNSSANVTNNHVDDLPLGATYETTRTNQIEKPPTPKQSDKPSPSTTKKKNPKGVELDNAGRVKSGKVRKQCELCGEWSNIKWFFKHMSEVHKALFCRCCREYLPIKEQEEHRKWHQEPPYMGQKIRIENGQPIIIDRKERASLTPIGSLAPWGGSSGGMVVKAVDDGKPPRKRKSNTNNTSGVENSSAESTPKKPNAMSPQMIGHMDYSAQLQALQSLQQSGTKAITIPGTQGNNAINTTAGSKDTLMPKETCPVCGIMITYKNLARHIKLRHKIKYKFCHKCRKLVPNETFDDHKLAHDRNEDVINEVGAIEIPPDMMKDDIDNADNFYDGQQSTENSIIEEGQEIIDENGMITIDGRKSEHFRANTSKTKLESLVGKEFKHPRRRCAICGYSVSYSNFKRHLRNAHPNEYQKCENNPAAFKKALQTLALSDNDDTNPTDLAGNHFLGTAMEYYDDNMDGDDSGDDHLEIAGLPVECELEEGNDSNESGGFGEQILMHSNHTDVEAGKPESSKGNAPANDASTPINGSIAPISGSNTPASGANAVTNGDNDGKRQCPVCNTEMEAKEVGKHCETKHKVSFKWCSKCSKYVLKKFYKSHLQKHNTGVDLSIVDDDGDDEEDDNDEGDDNDDAEEINVVDVKAPEKDSKKDDAKKEVVKIDLVKDKALLVKKSEEVSKASDEQSNKEQVTS